jgi:S-adenosylmethionine synthetase
MPNDAAAPVLLSAPAALHPDARPIEMVERKGRGHPDTICDALAEALTIALTRFYHARCGAVLHHNVDKVLLAAGSSTPRFGGGDVLAPFDIFFAGRATTTVDGTVVPVADIANETARRWLRVNLHALDCERHVRIHPLLRPGSSALRALVGGHHTERVLANDTSFAVGYAPPSRLERMVLAVEQALTAPAATAEHPAIGEDVKVMGLRRGQHVDLTIACAMVDRHLRTAAEYVDATAIVRQIAERAARRIHDDVTVTVNAADDLARGEMYLTVTGTSAEAADDGQTGRGNRVGGLITPYRPMTLEAAAGKNVVSHVGKSYSIVAHQIANELITTCPEVAAATCMLVSRIGSPVDVPQVVELQIQTRTGVAVDVVRGPAEAIARRGLAGLATLAQRLLDDASANSPAGWPGLLLF